MIRFLTLWLEICGEPVAARFVWGKSLTHPNYAADESEEFDESGTAKGSGTINESDIIESDDAHLEESEEIRENWTGQEEHSDSSKYADSCSDSNDDTDVDFSSVHDAYSCLILIILFLTNDFLNFLPH